jgi:mycofactocin system glycosyltransferase
MRYRLDRTFERHGPVVIGGSPLKLFRLTDAGVALVAQIAAGEPVARSTLVDRLLDAGVIHPAPDPAAAHRFTSGDVTVVVPAWCGPGRAPPASVVADAPPGAVVVDDASPLPVPGAAIRLARNAGPGAARMAGLERVTTPLVAFVDTDVLVPDGWLDRLLGHFDDERVALVAPRVRSAPAPGVLARYERGRSPIDLGPDRARIRAGTRVSYVPAAAIVARVDALRAVGGFDERLRVGEDVDLVWRLDAAGWACRYEPGVEVRHRPRADWRAWLAQRVAYGSSAAPLALRHPGALAPARMSGWSAAAWGLAAARRPLAGLALGAGTAAALVPRLPGVPAAVALRIAGLGTARAGLQLAEAVRRAWWPVVLVAATRSPAARRIGLLSMLAARHPLRLVDDLAYGAGVWKGAWRLRTPAPLLPRFTSWPGRAS